MLPMSMFPERSKQPLENMTIFLTLVKGKSRKGRQKKRWKDNINDWIGMDFASSARAAEDRTRWKGIFLKSSVVPQLRAPDKRGTDDNSKIIFLIPQ